jgi:hypothetical protein
MIRPVTPSEEMSTRGSDIMRSRGALAACRSLGAFAVSATRNAYIDRPKKPRGNKRGQRRNPRS